MAAKVCSDKVLMHLQGQNSKGISVYDAKDRPLAFAFEAERIINAIIPDEHNYLKAKAKLLRSKVYLAKADTQKAEALVIDARIHLVKNLKEKHPMIINKVETAWIECLNTRSEGDDRTSQILAACMECVRVCEEHYGEHNLHLIRPLYTAYTATIHSTQEAKNAVSQKMIDLQVDDTNIQDNQYIYKSQVVDIIMRIAGGLTQ